MMKNLKNTVLLMAVLLITACGYHLRGGLDLPEGLKNIYLQGASGQFQKSVKKSLRLSDAQLVDSAQQAGLIVNIIKEKMDRRVLSLSPTGRANEFELTYLLSFILLNADEKELSEQQEIEITRDYFNDQEEVLGKSNEEQTIREEMYRQGVQAVFSRARISLKKIDQ